MLKYNTMVELGFSIKNNFKNWLRFLHSKINPIKITTGLHKTIIIVSLAIFIILLVGACKTCKCPAYSQFESQNPSNTGVTAI
jgi:hypothetical protein